MSVIKILSGEKDVLLTVLILLVVPDVNEEPVPVSPAPEPENCVDAVIVVPEIVLFVPVILPFTTSKLFVDGL